VEKRIEFDGSVLPPDAGFATVRRAGFENELVLSVGEGPEELEQEPNNTAAQARRCVPPFAVTGRIDAPGDEDRVVMTVKKGDLLRLEVQSALAGLDPWLKVETMEGKQLQRSDDAAGRDPMIEWSAPEEGSFVVAVGNVVHRGGTDSYYRLSVTQPGPSVQVKVPAHSFTLEPGKTNEIKMTVKFEHGVKGKWTASVLGLPEVLSVETKEVPEKGGEVLWRVAPPDVTETFSGPCQFLVKDSESGRTVFGVHDLVTTGVDNGVPNGFNHLVIESIPQIWMTVKKPKPAPEKKSN
jgi:hypothetical protein